jgi:hypothetical protein
MAEIARAETVGAALEMLDIARVPRIGDWTDRAN